MSAVTHIRLGTNTASPDLARVHALFAPEQQRDLMERIGARAARELNAWWIRREATTPNKMGWPRQHFWARIADRTTYDPSATTPTTATVVSTERALAAKIHGATIRPTGGRKFLAIPLVAEAYGNSPGKKENSFIANMFVWRRGADLNGESPAFLATREGGELRFIYRLVRQVTVPKDPAALPPVEQLGAALAQTAHEWFRRQREQGASA